MDGLEVEKGASVTIVGDLHDNFGGLGWKLTVTKDGEMVFDEVDYDKILSWHFSKMPAGEYEVTLAVDDGQGGVTQQMFVLVVSAG